jgi:small subunit ribosomal protein S7
LDHHRRAGPNDKILVDRLSAELMDAANNRGNAVKTKTLRIAWRSQPRLSHYRW